MAVAIGTSVADDADAFDTEQRRSAVLGIVDPLAEILECAPRQNVAHLAGQIGFQRFSQHRLDRVHETFADLEGHIADESVADDDVGGAAVEIAPLDVADEIQW